MIAKIHKELDIILCSIERILNLLEEIECTAHQTGTMQTTGKPIKNPLKNAESRKKRKKDRF